MILTLPPPPSLNNLYMTIAGQGLPKIARRMKEFAAGCKDPIIARTIRAFAEEVTAQQGSRRVLTTEGREYKELAAKIARQSGIAKLHGPVEVKPTIFRPRRAGDLDNSLKALLDSVTGICWNDDSQVEHIDAWRKDDPSNPRAELEVVPLAGACVDLFAEAGT